MATNEFIVDVDMDMENSRAETIRGQRCMLATGLSRISYITRA